MEWGKKTFKALLVSFRLLKCVTFGSMIYSTILMEIYKLYINLLREEVDMKKDKVFGFEEILAGEIQSM